MLLIFYLFLLTCLVSPVTVYSAGSDNVLIDKQKLACMYEQIDDLLDDSNDNLVMVILTNQCAQSGDTKSDGMISRSLPSLTMNTNSTGDSSETLEPDDILMLTHAQLACFKENYKNLLVDERDPLPIEFNDSCK